MERKKFLFASIDGLINDMADGFVPKTDNRKNEIEGADIIIFDDVLGHGTKAQKLRKEERLVIGGTEYTDKLDDNLTLGQDELKKAGT